VVLTADPWCGFGSGATTWWWMRRKVVAVEAARHRRRRPWPPPQRREDRCHNGGVNADSRRAGFPVPGRRLSDRRHSGWAHPARRVRCRRRRRRRCRRRSRRRLGTDGHGRGGQGLQWPCALREISWISNHLKWPRSDTHRRNIDVCRLQVDPPYSGRGGIRDVKGLNKKAGSGCTLVGSQRCSLYCKPTPDWSSVPSDTAAYSS